MQTIARDATGRLVVATLAQKGERYFCLHCRGSVRRRKGLWRTPHFYHLSTGERCPCDTRSSLHRKIQQFIQQQFPLNALSLEVSFPDVSRVADIVWSQQRLIFEVQCSPISSWEVARRIEDYARVGYQIVWLLHDTQFYRRRLRAAELLLRKQPYAFITSTCRLFVDRSPIDRGYRTQMRPTDISLYPFQIARFLPPQAMPQFISPSWIREFYYRCLLKWC